MACYPNARECLVIGIFYTIAAKSHKLVHCSENILSLQYFNIYRPFVVEGPRPLLLPGADNQPVPGHHYLSVTKHTLLTMIYYLYTYIIYYLYIRAYCKTILHCPTDQWGLPPCRKWFKLTLMENYIDTLLSGKDVHVLLTDYIHTTKV